MSKCIALSFLLPRVKSRVTGSVSSETPRGFAPVEDLAGGAAAPAATLSLSTGRHGQGC